MRARDATAHANALLEMFFGARHGAELLRAAALQLDPEAELPELKGVGQGADVEQLISGYRAQADKDKLNIEALLGELKAAQDLLDGSSSAAVAALITQLRSASNIKEVREVFAVFDASNTAKE